jgi:hypothetical protein
MSPAYLDAVAATDRLVAKVRRRSPPRRRSRAHAVILTSDHGGRGASHRQPARAVNYTVPFMVWGPDVAAGADLYAINADYTNPQRERTSYADAPIRNGDVANWRSTCSSCPPSPTASTTRLRTSSGWPSQLVRPRPRLNRQPSSPFDCCIITGAADPHRAAWVSVAEPVPSRG